MFKASAAANAAMACNGKQFLSYCIRFLVIVRFPISTSVHVTSTRQGKVGGQCYKCSLTVVCDAQYHNYWLAYDSSIVIYNI